MILTRDQYWRFHRITFYFCFVLSSLFQFIYFFFDFYLSWLNISHQGSLCLSYFTTVHVFVLTHEFILRWKCFWPDYPANQVLLITMPTIKSGFSWRQKKLLLNAKYIGVQNNSGIKSSWWKNIFARMTSVWTSCCQAVVQIIGFSWLDKIEK